jgi:hypothetical protein
VNEREVIEFLSRSQPLPDDGDLSEELIGQYDDARKFLIDHPSDEGVRLILNSFGIGDGWGVYQLVEDAVAAVSPEVAAKHLAEALRSPLEGVKYWSAQISANYDDEQLIEPLQSLLHDPSEDVRMAALVSIEKYMSDKLKAELQKMLAKETSDEIRATIKDILVGAT